MNVVTSMYVLAGFFTFYAIWYVWLAKHQDAPGKKDSLWLSSKVIFLTLALLYAGIAHLSAFSAIGYASEHQNNVTCENLVANSTDVSASVTTYEYTNSCLGRARYAPVDNLVVFFTWMIFLGGLILLFQLIRMIGRMLTVW